MLDPLVYSLHWRVANVWVVQTYDFNFIVCISWFFLSIATLLDSYKTYYIGWALQD